MIRKLDKVRAGRANYFTGRWRTFIRDLDRFWFRVLGFIHRWTIRQAESHCRREKLRRFQRLMASNRAFLN